MSKVEAVFIFDDGTWDTEIIEIPDDIAKKQSHDEFIQWLYETPEGDQFIDDSGGFLAAFIWSWGIDTGTFDF